MTIKIEYVWLTVTTVPAPRLASVRAYYTIADFAFMKPDGFWGFNYTHDLSEAEVQKIRSALKRALKSVRQYI